MSFAAESVEGDDERTGNERSSPDVSPDRKRKCPRNLSASGGGVGELQQQQQQLTIASSSASGGGGADQPRRGPRTRSRPNHRRSSSASGSETGQQEDQQQMALSTVSSSNRLNSGGSPQQAQENGRSVAAHSKPGEENLRRKRRNNRKRNHRKWKPYARLTWEEKKELDELESKRATKKRANRPTPYNTTQFLMEDHKVDTPDLSAGGTHIPGDSSDADELFNENDDIRDGDFLEREFSAMYDEVQSERLQSMSKEQLVSEVLTLSKRVTELEGTPLMVEKRTADHSCPDGKNMNGHSSAKENLMIRARLESLDDLEHEVQRLREENSVLKRANHSLEQKEPC